MIARNALRRQRAIQGQVARADRKHPEVALAMQAGAREYPGPLFPEPHQSKPGSEAALNPAPFYDAPYYRDSGKLQNKVALKRTKEKVESEGKKCLLISGGCLASEILRKGGSAAPQGIRNPRRSREQRGGFCHH
jgi:hypothetical protein